MFDSMVLESNPHAIHFPPTGMTTDDGLTRCGGMVSRVARVTAYSSLVTCMTCASLLTDRERLEMRQSEPYGA